MKALKLLPIFGISFFMACNAAESPECVSPADSAFLKLMSATDNGCCLYAMQDGLCYGRGWHPEASEMGGWPFEKCDVKDVVGDYPAIAGFDLGGIEYGNEANLDGVNFDFMRRAAVAHAGRGGIVTFSWHPGNPLTGGNAWDVSSDQVVASVLEGGERHDMFMEWLCRAADFLESCADSSGCLVPIIFRPWHENTGSWFWWGEKLSSVEDYLSLWQMTYNYLATDRGLDMLWAYSPSSTLLKEKALDRYPGDGIVDIIGVDRYARKDETETDPSYIEGMQDDLAFLGDFAQKHSLLLAVTETGQEGQTCPDWWTGELLKGIGGHPVCYVLTWRNAWDPEHEGHWFSPFNGAPTEEDFLKFYNSPKTSFLNDIQ